MRDSSQSAIIWHGPRNEVGRAYSGLELLRLRLGIRPFRTCPWQHYRRNDAEFCGEEGQVISIPRFHQAIKSRSLLVQDNTQEGSVDVETAIVFNEAQFLEFIHEKIDPAARCSYHFRQCLLRYFGDHFLRLVLLAILS